VGVNSDQILSEGEAFFLASIPPSDVLYEFLRSFLRSRRNDSGFSTRKSSRVHKSKVLAIFGCPDGPAIKMRYARVGAMRQPQNQSQPHPQSDGDHVERPQGITMEVSACSPSLLRTTFSCSDLANYANQYQFLRTKVFSCSVVSTCKDFLLVQILLIARGFAPIAYISSH
jgi:hypothetical protein